MRRAVRKIFGIYLGESKTILRFVRLAFFWAFGSSIAETLSISLFLEKLGASRLPFNYTLTSLAMIGSSCLFLYLLRLTSPSRVFISLLTSASLFYTITSFLLFPATPLWFWFCLQIFTAILITASIACFWTFADQYHDLQDAKRIYGIYNATYFLGYVFSGTLINLSVKAIGIVPLLLISAFFLALAAAETLTISRKIIANEDDTGDSLFDRGKKSLPSLLRLFCSSSFVLFLVATSLTIQLLRTTTEFSFLATFRTCFEGENSLPEFLGKCKAWIAFGNILFGMFFYRRFVRRMGLCNLILFPPLIFFMLYSEWLIYDTLLIAVLGVIAVEGVLFTLEDNNFNLLINAAPSKIRGALRIINDSFFEPIGMLISSLFLLLLPTQNKLLGFGLSLLFLTTSLIIRILYPKSLYSNLQQNALYFERKIAHWLEKFGLKEKKEMIKDLLRFLSHPLEEERLIACQSLITSKDPSILAPLLSHADTFSIKEKIALLQLFDHSPFAHDPKLLEKIDQWIQEDSLQEEGKKWANFYLAKRGLLHPEKVSEKLDSSDLIERATAIITLKKSLASQSLANVSLNRTIAAKEIDLLLSSSQEREIAIGLEILCDDPSFSSIEKVLSFLFHPSLSLQRSAAKALARLADKSFNRYCPKIIDALKYSSDNAFRMSCLEALGKIADSSTVVDIISCSTFFRPSEKRLAETVITLMGRKTVPSLIALTRNVKIHDRCRILTGKILGRLALPQLQAILADIIFIEIERAYFYFFYGHTIQKQYPLYDLSLLQQALLTGFRSAIDFILHLLGAASPIEDCDLVVRALHNSSNAKAHAHAIETLEKNCELRIFQKILPLIDDIPVEEKLEICFQQKEKYPKLSLLELLNTLAHSPSLFDKTVAAHLKAKLQMPRWRESLREEMKSCDGPFQQFAYELLES